MIASRAAALAAILFLSGGVPAHAVDHAVELVAVPIMKPVFGQVQSRDTVAARARIGGTVARVNVDEGDAMEAGDVVALVADERPALQLDAI